MSLAFTICANNYLAHATILAKSFKKHHPDKKFVIAILDKPSTSINYDLLGADKVIWIDQLFPDLVNSIKDTYNIAEICTVVKPKLFLHFYKNNNDTVLYIDPDIKVFSEFKEVFSNLENHDVVLTPHICSPTGEVGHPLDKDLMRTGIYNLGFLATKNSEEVINFVKWWDKRVRAFGYHDLRKGFFYDQIWLGYAPAFLDKVFVLRHLGYNVANWNLHEREVTNRDGFFINDDIPLRFFHYSHFKMENAPVIASYNQNFNLDNRKDIVPVFDDYIVDLKNNNYDNYKLISYVYGKQPDAKVSLTKKSKFKKSRYYRVLYLIKKAAVTLIKGQ